jgi:hypothetical protein
MTPQIGCLSEETVAVSINQYLTAYFVLFVQKNQINMD